MKTNDTPQVSGADGKEASTGAPTLTPLRLISKTELRKIVPYTPQHILRLEKRGLFPRRLQLGANRVAWLLGEVEQWITMRIAERDATARHTAERRAQSAHRDTRKSRIPL